MPPKTASPFEDLDMGPQFQTWAKTHAVTPVLLHRRTGWSYQYCHALVSGRQKFGYHSFGMIICAFGIEALEYILDLAPEKLKEPQ